MPGEGGVALGTGLTSIWIPVGLLTVIGIFMVFQFIAERRLSAELEREEAEALAKEAAKAAAAPPPPTEAPASTDALAKPAETAPVMATPAPLQNVIKIENRHERRRIRPFRRTAWIWFPFLVGFCVQGYYDFGKQYVDLGQAYNDYLKPIVTKYLG